MPSASYPLFGGFLMNDVITVTFSAATPVAAGAYCDRNYTTGGGRR